MAADYRDYLIKRFPYLEKAIDDLLASSDDFRSLCKDYVDAVEALNRWEDSARPATVKNKIIEYRRLVRNLEAEILVELYRVTGV